MNKTSQLGYGCPSYRIIEVEIMVDLKTTIMADQLTDALNYDLEIYVSIYL